MKIKSPLNSLQGRLFFASIFILPLVLVIAGFALSNAYQSSLEESFKEQLRVQAYLLLGSVELKDGSINFPNGLPEPRYNAIGSGLYVIVYSSEGKLIWRSKSSLMLENNQLSNIADFSGISAGTPLFNYLEDEHLFSFQLRIDWELSNTSETFFFILMESDELMRHDISVYNQRLVLWMVIIFLVALLAQTLILKWGLKPMLLLAHDLKAIESGKTEKLEGSYPSEVTLVTENLNELIESERKQRERYRNTLGDLAHSLKTPLAVVQGAEIESYELGSYQKLVNEQVERMDQIVKYQLSRAVKSDKKTRGRAFAIRPVVVRILGALTKVYIDKEVKYQINIEPDLVFSGDEHDLMEILGNILENAFKYGKSQVHIVGKIKDKTLKLSISDDGDGVSPNMRQTILRRGERLDTSIQGQGIGLSVVTDIVSSYQGEIEIKDSALGGAKFILYLPI